jgi:hypothetical protein
MNSFLSGPYPYIRSTHGKERPNGCFCANNLCSSRPRTDHDDPSWGPDCTGRYEETCCRVLAIRHRYRLSSNPARPDSMYSTQNRLSENALHLYT